MSERERIEPILQHLTAECWLRARLTIIFVKKNNICRCFSKFQGKKCLVILKKKKIESHLFSSCSKSIENTLQSLPITQIGNGLERNSSFTFYPPYCNAKMYTVEQTRGVAPSVCMANLTCQPKKRTGLGLSTKGLLLITSLRVQIHKANLKMKHQSSIANDVIHRCAQ